MAIRPFVVDYHPTVVRDDIPALDRFWHEAVRTAIEEKLMRQPELFGAPLRQSLKGFWKLRVGDYRVVYRIAGKRVTVFAILHCSDAYPEMQKRAGRV